MEAPTVQQFIDDVCSVYSDGDLLAAHRMLIEHLEMFRKLDNTPLTWEYILEKFSAHHKQWSYKYSTKESKGYLSKEADLSRKSIAAFMNEQMYWQEFVVKTGSSERDQYIFGNFTIRYLCDRLVEFQEKYPHENKAI